MTVPKRAPTSPVIREAAMDSPRRRWWRGLFVVVLMCGATLVYFVVSSSSPGTRKHSFSSTFTHNNDALVETNITASFPDILMQKVYNKKDFINEKGIVPSFWRNQNENTANQTITWGPCYPPKQTVDWDNEIDFHSNMTQYHPVKRESNRLQSSNDLSDYCRPGFIIIGAGKCGTSSLYHYIVGHPRVLPASQKQIHYFKVRLFKYSIK